MFSRIRVAFGIGLLLSLITSITVFAKGGFSFIAITGPNLKEAVRTTDPELTSEFFAFADFYQDKTKAPADPGVGYEITRYYVDGSREIAFDHLHYYPETSFVYYDGIVNGSSEYDGEWYTARPEIKAAFESVLPGQTQSVAPAAQSEPSASLEPIPAKPSVLEIPLITLMIVTAGLAVILVLAFRVRKPSTR